MAEALEVLFVAKFVLPLVAETQARANFLKCELAPSPIRNAQANLLPFANPSNFTEPTEPTHSSERSWP